MASFDEIVSKVQRRFKDAPLVETADVEDWVERSFMEHNHDQDEDIPRERELLIRLYAEWDGSMQLSLNTAYYFSYSDHEEDVDQRMVSEAYRNAADKLWTAYEQKAIKAQNSTSPAFVKPPRADRR